MTNKAIEVDGLSFKYDNKLILDDISFSISSGDVVVLMGLNGSGKSTLINCIMGFLKPKSGNIFIQGNDITKINNHELAYLISYVPQNIGNSCMLGVLEYLTLGRIVYRKMYENVKQADYDCVFRYADEMNIKPLLGKKMNELSGGERQLVAITKALIQETPIIVFDEPMAALDYKNQIMYLKVIEELRAAGKTVLFSSHNPNHALALNAKIALIHKKSLYACGKSTAVLSDEILQSIYGANIQIIEKSQRKYCVFDL